MEHSPWLNRSLLPNITAKEYRQPDYVKRQDDLKQCQSCIFFIIILTQLNWSYGRIISLHRKKQQTHVTPSFFNVNFTSRGTNQERKSKLLYFQHWKRFKLCLLLEFFSFLYCSHFCLLLWIIFSFSLTLNGPGWGGSGLLDPTFQLNVTHMNYVG